MGQGGISESWNLLNNLQQISIRLDHTKNHANPSFKSQTLIISYISNPIMQSPTPPEFTTLLTRFLSGPGQSPQSKQQFKQLQSTINSFTKTRECWGTVLSILLGNPSIQLKTFTSSILKDKMKYDFGQLPLSDFPTIHQSILQVAIANPTPQYGLLFNISLTLTYSYMQQMQVLGGLLEYLYENLGKHGLLNYVFTVILLLPEEVDNYKVVIEEKKRESLLGYLRGVQGRVLEEVDVVAEQHWEKKTIRRATLLDCFSNWIQLQYTATISSKLPNSFLLNASLTFLSDTSISSQCQHTLKTVLTTLHSPSQDPTAFLFLAQHIFPYFSTCKKLITEGLNDMCENYINVLSQFGQKVTSEFVKECDKTSEMFQQGMMYLTREVGVELMEPVVRYWRGLLIGLSQGKGKEEGQVGIIGKYRGLLEALYAGLVVPAQLTIEECEELNTMSERELQKMHQDFEQKVKYRKSIIQLYDLLGQLLGYDKCVQLGLSSVYSLDTKRPLFWPQLQSLLLPLPPTLQTLTTPSPTLTQTLLKLITLSPPYYPIQQSIIRVVASSSSLYKQNPQVTKTIFSYLVKQLGDQNLADAAAQAFEDVCENNAKFVVENLEAFLEVFRVYKNDEKILNGMVVAVGGDPGLLLRYLPQICLPYVEEIANPSTPMKLKTSIKRLSEIILKVTGDNCVPIVEELFKTVWPLIKPFVQNPGIIQKANPQRGMVAGLIQRSCKFLKVSMRALKTQFAPYLRQVFSTLLTAYSTHPMDSYVYCVQVAVTAFSSHPQFLQPLNQIYTRTCELTFQHLLNFTSYQTNPDLAEDFFGMNMRFMRYAPNIILYCNKLDDLIKLCISACGVGHRQVANALYGFIQSLLNVFWSREFIDDYNERKAEEEEFRVVVKPEFKEGYARLRERMLGNAGRLVQGMVGHLANSPSQSVRDSIRDAMEAEIKAFPEENQVIWTPVLVQMGEDIMTQAEKKEFLELLPKVGLGNLEQVREYIYAISKRYIHRNTRSVGN